MVYIIDQAIRPGTCSWLNVLRQKAFCLNRLITLFSTLFAVCLVFKWMIFMLLIYPKSCQGYGPNKLGNNFFS